MHAKWIGILYIIYGCYCLFLTILSCAFYTSRRATGKVDPDAFYNPSLTEAVLWTVGLSIVAAGYIWLGADFKRGGNWTRGVFGYLLVLYSAFDFPVGIFLGVYAMWFLIAEEKRKLRQGASAKS